MSVEAAPTCADCGRMLAGAGRLCWECENAGDW